MFANTQQYYQDYPQSQAPNTSGMNASQAPPIPDHSQLSLPQSGPIVGNFGHLGQPSYPNGKQKRMQVKNACTNCQKSCKKCADIRPCPRCVKYGQTETCVNSVRKERQKGIKRGPYRKRKQGDGMEGNAPGASAIVPGVPNGMYPTPTSGVTGGDTRGVMAYQAYGNATGQFENFAPFHHGQYLPYNILNNMNNIIQQATANANGAVKNATSSQQSMNGGNNNNSDNKTSSSTEVDENGKLNILSQLCTAVLDRDPNASENKDTDQIKPKVESKPAVMATAAPANDANVSQSNTHSRESTASSGTTVTATTDNNNINNNNNNNNNGSSAAPKSNQPAPGDNADSDDDHPSRYGTPEAEMAHDVVKND